MKIIGIIPARKGSKGVKNKNIKLLNNIPLIAHTIKSALESKVFDKIIVSTDSIKIANISKSFGAEVPFIRPKYLSTDRALAIPTIRHALKKSESIFKEEYEVVCMLQPTSPLRKKEHYHQIFRKFKKNFKKYDSTISVKDVGNYHPYKMKKIRNNELIDYEKWPIENPPRQSLPKIYIVNGAFYIFKRKIILENNSFKGKKCLPFIMSENESINIDNQNDFLLAEKHT